MFPEATNKNHIENSDTGEEVVVQNKKKKKHLIDINCKSLNISFDKQVFINLNCFEEKKSNDNSELT